MVEEAVGSEVTGDGKGNRHVVVTAKRGFIEKKCATPIAYSAFKQAAPRRLVSGIGRPAPQWASRALSGSARDIQREPGPLNQGPI
jgi:hypothetical protein